MPAINEADLLDDATINKIAHVLIMQGNQVILV